MSGHRQESGFEGSYVLDVHCHFGKCSHGSFKSVVRSNHACVEPNCESDVQRVIHWSTDSVRKRVGILRQRSTCDSLDRDMPYIRNESLALFELEFTPTNLLPDRVGGLSKQQVRRKIVVCHIEQAPSSLAVNLGYKPLHDHTRIDDENTHRVSRSSRINVALSVCLEPPRRFNHWVERRRVSASRRAPALRRT